MVKGQTLEDVMDFDVREISNVDHNQITLGGPVNPNSKTGVLFPGNYITYNNLRLPEFLPYLGGRVNGTERADIEFHLQEISEIPGTPEEYELFSDLANLLRGRTGLIAHLPFMSFRNPKEIKPYDFDFVWLGVPPEDENTPISEGSKLFKKRMPLESVYRTIDLCHDLGIHYLTVHVRKPGVFPKEYEWDLFKRDLEAGRQYIEEYGKNVELVIETGGIQPERLLELTDDGWKINYDTAHIFLDLESLNPGRSDADICKGVEYLAEGMRSHIAVYHFTGISSTLPYTDDHLGISEEGVLDLCNRLILKMYAKDRMGGKDVRAMVESKFDPENLSYVSDVLRDEAKVPQYALR